MPPRRSSDATKSSQTPEAEKSDMHETFAAYFKPQEIATQILVEVKKAETRVFDEEGGIQQSFVENIAGKNGSRVYLTEKFPEDYPQERVERVMSTQQTAKDAYKMLSKHDTGLLKKIIPPGEKILAQMSTVGFVGFPTTDEELSGPGMIIITDKQLYLYWSCSRYEASAFDHITGSTFCCCPRGFCGCFKCCRYYSGAYSHVGVREAEEKIAFIPTSQITPGGVRSERADRLVIERRAIFGNEDGEEFSCAECCCKIVCFPCIYCPCPSCACCFYHGQMVFSFSSDSSKSLIQNKIMTNIKNKSRDEQIYDGRLRVLTLRYVDLACNKVWNRRSIVTREKRVGNNLLLVQVKHISCIVDKDQVAAEDLHKFCAAVNSTCKAEEYLKNFQQVSSPTPAIASFKTFVSRGVVNGLLFFADEQHVVHRQLQKPVAAQHHHEERKEWRPRRRGLQDEGLLQVLQPLRVVESMLPEQLRVPIEIDSHGETAARRCTWPEFRQGSDSTSNSDLKLYARGQLSGEVVAQS
eukprot:765075-Hanusia_phi.AAC.3